jgi:hypothetical protein
MRMSSPGCLAVCLLALVAGRLIGSEAESGLTERTWKSLPPADPLPRPGMKLLQKTIDISELRIRAGDDPAWADPGYDDLGWAVTRYPDLPAHTGIFWLRVHLRVSAPEQLPSGFRTEAVGAREMFRDGQRVAGSGRPGASREAEEPGPLSVFGTLSPAMRAPGEHVVG